MLMSQQRHRQLEWEVHAGTEPMNTDAGLFSLQPHIRMARNTLWTHKTLGLLVDLMSYWSFRTQVP